jgi:hypothetical protein
MKKLYLLVLMVLLSFSYGKAQVNLYNTNFDALTAGGYAALQLGAPWSTWSNAPGGAEDPHVSTTYAHSSANSVGVVLNNDFIFNFNDRTTGRYNISFWMYVAAGHLGYYNFLSDLNGASSKWAFQVWICNDSIYVDAGGSVAAKIPYTFDSWNKMNLIIDLDDDFASFLMNNTEVISYQYSKGAFGTDNSKKLDAIDFYGWDGTQAPVTTTGTPGYFIDDLNVDSVLAPNAPSNLTANLNGADIDVTWTAPTPAPDSYKLARNGTVVYSGTGLSYTDLSPWANTYIYGARAYYAGLGYSHSNTDTATIAGGVTRNLVLMEGGTGLWCGYCPGAAMGLRDLIDVNHKNACAIEYHSGDSLEVTASTNRIAYYNITGFPTVIADGKLSVVGGNATTSMYASYLPMYDTRYQMPAFHNLNVDLIETTPNNYTATIVVEQTFEAWASGQKLFAALTESNLPISWGNQTEVDFCCRGMYPDANGTTLDFSTQTKDTIVLNFSTAGHVKNNCEFVVFVQHVASKEVTQTMKIDLSSIVGIQELQGKKISMYPNPAQDYVTLLTSGKGNADIFDITGKLVLSVPLFASAQSIDISGLSKGIYVVKVNNSDNNFTSKLVVE